MPRQPRLDTPGAVHHVIARGIEQRKIFREKEDYADFVLRLGRIITESGAHLFAWVLMSNHFHLLIQTGPVPLSTIMRRLLTGYAVHFNRRHTRFGHLFQNRYKSILCEADPYLLELTRYIHLNPIRAGLVPTLRALDSYPWSGHASLIGKGSWTWQTTDEILSKFGKKRTEARLKYREFLGEGFGLGKRPELTGGGLLRSTGGWSEVVSFRRRKERLVGDERILGRSDFVKEVLKEIEARELAAQKSRNWQIGIDELCQRIAQVHRVDCGELATGSCRREVVRARADIALLTRRLGLNGAAVARRLGVTTSCIAHLAARSKLSVKGQKFLE